MTARGGCAVPGQQRSTHRVTAIAEEASSLARTVAGARGTVGGVWETEGGTRRTGGGWVRGADGRVTGPQPVGEAAVSAWSRVWSSRAARMQEGAACLGSFRGGSSSRSRSAARAAAPSENGLGG